MLVLARKMQTASALGSFVLKARSAAKLPVQEIVDLSYIHCSVAPYQVKQELLELAQIVRDAKPQRMLEIGTNTGGTFFVLCQNCDQNATVISLDLPGARFGYQAKFYREALVRRMIRPGQDFHAIRMDSHIPDAMVRVHDVLRGEKLDLLFIDGDHTYAGVKQDFEMFSPFVREGGVIGFHDIVPHPAETGCEVNRFWNEIKGSYRHKEIVFDPKQGWAGIGVLYCEESATRRIAG
jgi:predicted O-methyltransferase YrrM